MKIVYCIGSMCTRAGMESILYNKAKLLSEQFGNEIIIITTDADKGKVCFESTPLIKYIDLKINYFELKEKTPIERRLGILKKLSVHKKKLKNVISSVKPDVVVSMGDLDEWILPSINNGIPIVNECHFHYTYRLDEEKTYYQRLRLLFNKKIKEKYDVFVTLTDSDKTAWNIPDSLTIPNFSTIDFAEAKCNIDTRKVIAAGRLVYQKGFDRLIKIWTVMKSKYDDIWPLDIYGDGEMRTVLQSQILESGLEDFVFLKGNTDNMKTALLSGTIFALSSRYEGFPLVLIEAMSAGLAPVSFDCKQGPGEIVTDGKNGFLIPNDDENIELFADKLYGLMSDKALLEKISAEAYERARDYSPYRIAEKWDKLFRTLKKEKQVNENSFYM